MKIIWGLQQTDKTQLHSQFVYDMFYVSIQMVKDLGYETVLYGSTDAIQRLGTCVDEVHNTDDLDYLFFDDLKIHILETRKDDYLLIDGDVFIHSPIIFKNTNSFVWIDTIVKAQYGGIMKDALSILNTFDIPSIVPEWNSQTKISFSTGLLRIKNNNGLIDYYIHSYKKLRNWFLENQKTLIETDSNLDPIKSLSSHLICEHLLQRMVEYYGLQFEELDKENSYYHWQGYEKFKNNNMMECIRLVSDTHKIMGGSIKNVYDYLLNDGKIKPILYP